MPARLRLALLLFCSLDAACHRSTPSAIDPALAFCVPAGTTLLAGVDLDQLRASPLYRSLSPGAAALVEPLRGASFLMLASNSAVPLAIARGSFSEAPAGSVLIAPGLAVLGSPDAVTAARAQHRSRTIAAPELLSYAEPLAANPIWAVALGTATLPVSGNLANLNNFLHSTAYATAVGRIGDRLSFELNAICRNPDESSRLERTLRAFISLAGMRGNSLGDIRLDRQNLTVRVTLSADAAAAERLLR